MLTAAVEEYLEAIYKMQQVDEPLIAARLAERMDVSPPTVADMLKRMQEGGLVKVSRESGITLTSQGNEAAETLVRRHRLAERLLTDVLGLSWDEVHEEACRLEHAISGPVEERLLEVLGNPETCPHGHPIPGIKARTKVDEGKALSELSVGDEGVIQRVTEEEPQLLQYLADLGLLPGAKIAIKEVAPFRGPVLVKVSGAQYALGQEVAAKIMVRSK
ncbi:MAG: metal-dependent transcriptional regulator [Thermoleophilia bacterium]